jgi:glycosyltransferase involved in cell wall biosynthesis
LEAMAHGVAVITLPGAARSSPIRHGQNGLVANNAREFAEYVVQLSRDRELCRRLGQAARETIASEYSPQSHVARWAQAIDAAAARRASGGPRLSVLEARV